MGSFSIFHWLLVLAIILILFGAGKLPSVMGDLAKGIKAFRSGLKEDSEMAGETAPPPAPAPAPITHVVPPPGAVQPPSSHSATTGDAGKSTAG